MRSEVAKDLDSTYNRMQWAGEEYLLEEVVDISNGKITSSSTPISSEVMYWIGYIYRYCITTKMNLVQRYIVKLTLKQ